MAQQYYSNVPCSTTCWCWNHPIFLGLLCRMLLNDCMHSCISLRIWGVERMSKKMLDVRPVQWVSWQKNGWRSLHQEHLPTFALTTMFLDVAENVTPATCLCIQRILGDEEAIWYYWEIQCRTKVSKAHRSSLDFMMTLLMIHPMMQGLTRRTKKHGGGRYGMLQIMFLSLLCMVFSGHYKDLTPIE